MGWGYRDQIGVARTYLDACDKTAYMNLGILGNPIQYMHEQLDMIESLATEENLNLKKKNTKSERDALAEKLKVAVEALESIAAEHLDPFRPELLGNLLETVMHDTQLARETLKQIRGNK